MSRITFLESYKVRPNEGEEHAFLCWLAESFLRKKGLKPKSVSTSGPDLEVTVKKRKICFEIETGKRLKFIKRTGMEGRFSERKRLYDEVYLIVPNERVGRRYQSLCKNIITKAELEGFIDTLVHSLSSQGS